MRSQPFTFEADPESLGSTIRSFFDTKVVSPIADYFVDQPRQNAIQAQLDMDGKTALLKYQASARTPADRAVATAAIARAAETARTEAAAAGPAGTIRSAPTAYDYRFTQPLADFVYGQPQQDAIQKKYDERNKQIIQQYQAGPRTPELREATKMALAQSNAEAKKEASLVGPSNLPNLVAQKAQAATAAVQQAGNWLQDNRKIVIGVAVVAGVLVLLYLTRPALQIVASSLRR